ncbi:uncharacterized protein LOC123008485 isoform X2 [Tribolium madens]|uniref:uncharacterized protein LOC123008485 isoform X2 n=1 Tax=Tribolium madens TaxID=41895 RepID=UPI001CF73DF0|nr:uncharacterized protein LOC123008485 isoform X2 [Tribolium madens]
MHFWKSICFYLSLNNFICAYVVTFAKNISVTCVLSEETVFSAAYIDILEEKSDKNYIPVHRKTNKININLDDDWNITDVTHFPYSPILDQRWESFNDRNMFFLEQSVTSFSIYANKNLKFSVRETNYMYSQDFILPDESFDALNDRRWFHYSIKRKDNSVYIISENGTLIRNIMTDFKPGLITADTTMRIHHYTFRYSHQISSNPRAIYNIFFENETCLSMFVSIDKHCFLDVTLKSDTNSIINKTVVAGFNDNESLKTWKRIEIKAFFSGNATLSFKRKRNDFRTEGYWAIDKIQYCKKNIEVIVQNCTKCQCKVLNQNNEFDKKIFDNPGFLGNKINCSDVLGNSYPYCEKHKIYVKNKIFCAWGYQGSLCNITCPFGYWGIDCAQKCKPNCESCNHIKGCISNTTQISYNQTSIENYCKNVTEEVSNTPREPTLLLSSTHDIILMCPLIEYSENNFYINVLKDGSKKIKESNITINNYNREYNYSVPVEYMQKYDVYVETSNRLEKFVKEFKVTVLQPFEKFSSKPFVQICTAAKCLLLVPTPKNFKKDNAIFFVMKKQKVDDDKLLKLCLSNENKRKENCWKVEPIGIIPDNIKLEIGQNINDAVRVENETFITYLRYNDSKNILLFPIIFERNENNTTTIVLIIILLTISIIFLIITVIIVRNQIASEILNVNAEVIPLQNIVTTTADENSNYISNEMFEDYLDKKLQRTELEREFESMPTTADDKSWDALRFKNLNKNKDKRNILPFDYNRVVLKPMKWIGSEDYINASYIDGYSRQKVYIAAQGPKFNTVQDFWRMIWQNNIETIIMATDLFENNERMCAEYWPQSLKAILECGNMNIISVKTKSFEYFVKSKLEVSYNKNKRVLHHVHFRWKNDKKQFLYPNDILPVVKLIKNTRENGFTPILIHSGFGTNRTGTLILCDLALEMLDIKSKVSFYKLTKGLRKQRHNIINSTQYYILAHLIVSEYLMEQKSPFVKKNGEKKEFQEQLDYLKKICRHDEIIRCWMSEDKTYNIPLRFVPGYGKPKKYLVTPQPKRNDFQKFAEFWFIIADESINYVVFLNKMKKNVQLWPYRFEHDKVIIKVECLNCTESVNCLTNEVSLIIYDKGTSVIQHQKNIFFYELKEEKNLSENLANNILKLICDVKINCPIAVSCNDGIKMSGLFIVLSYIIEKYENEIEVDVCNAIRIARRGNSQFLNSLEQLKFLHTCVAQYLENFERYDVINN